MRFTALLKAALLTLCLITAPGCKFCELTGSCEPDCDSTSPTAPTSNECRSTPNPLPGGSAILPIAPVVQQTEVWCWAAAAEMVFRHYGLPNLNGFGNYQCGIVGSWFGGACATQSCSFCRFPVGVMSNEHAVITGYGPFAQSLGVPSRVLRASLIFRSLTVDEIKTEIDNRRPVVIGINPGGGFALPNASQHIAVLIGYDYTGSAPIAVVNDPFPFDLPPFSQMGNPYTGRGAIRRQPGQYGIRVDTLANQLQWANTIFQIQ
jgi:hypothetical protein